MCLNVWCTWGCLSLFFSPVPWSYDLQARDVAIGIQGLTCLVIEFLGPQAATKQPFLLFLAAIPGFYLFIFESFFIPKLADEQTPQLSKSDRSYLQMLTAADYLPGTSIVVVQQAPKRL